MGVSISEDERLELVAAAAEAHSGLKEVAFKLRRELPAKDPALKEAVVTPGQVVASPSKVLWGLGELGKGCLATLARAVDQYDWRVFQRFRKSAFNIAWVKRWLRHRLIARLHFGRLKV